MQTMLVFGRALALVALCLFAGQSNAALVPPYFFSSVVALGDMQSVPELGKANTTKWVTEGTGFFYGYLVQDDPDITKKKYAIFLVTAGHVVKSHPVNATNTISVRIDATETTAKAKDFQIPTANWFFHPSPDIDLAAVPISVDFLKSFKLNMGFFASDQHALTKKQMVEAETAAGDGVFILVARFN
jgi:hypothetical protein